MEQTTQKLSLRDIEEAHNHIRPYIRRTPLELSVGLSEAKKAEVYLKLENHQVSGSFKARGAFHRLLSLTKEERRRGVIASTAGNHGIGLAFAGHRLKIPVKVFLPQWADPQKQKLLRRYAADLSFFDSVESAREEAKRVAIEKDLTFVSAYNDPWMIAGGGTVALEILQDLEKIDAIFLGMGGGGLAAGVCLAAKSLKPGIKICTIQSENSPLMTEWLKAGKPVSTPLSQSLAEGLAVNMELDTMTFPLLRGKIDEMILVSETEIKESLVWALEEHQMVLEGAGAATIAGIRKHALKGENRIAGILTGQNISLRRFYGVLKERLG